MRTKERVILDALKAPKFVYRYGRSSGIKNMPSPGKTLTTTLTTKKYRELLAGYNTFVIFDWKMEKNLRINRAHFWSDFVKNICNKELKSKSLFLPDKLNNESFDNSLNYKHLQNATEYRCAFLHVQSVYPLKNLLDYCGDEGSKLGLYSLGLRVKSHKNESFSSSVASYIQPLLEESASLYTNINYEKLLKIAKQTENNEDRDARSFLSALAENGLSTPKLLNDDTWLLFTFSK